MATDFVLFPTLPLELRQEIWRHALSAPAVWAVTYKYGKKLDPRPGCFEPEFHVVKQRFCMVSFVGSAPNLVGCSCREANSMLRETHTRILQLVTSQKAGRDAASPSSCWVNLESTVLDLGSYTDIDHALRIIRREDLARLRYVALSRPAIGSFDATFRRLAEAFPALRRIILQDETTRSGKHIPRRPLSIETAAKFMAESAPIQAIHPLFNDDIRDTLLADFAEPKPTVHRIPIDPALNVDAGLHEHIIPGVAAVMLGQQRQIQAEAADARRD